MMSNCEHAAEDRKGLVASVGPPMGPPGAVERSLEPYFGKLVCFTCGGIVENHPKEDTDSVSSTSIGRRLVQLGILNTDGSWA